MSGGYFVPDIDGGLFMVRNLSPEEERSHKYGREVGKILPGHNAPDALIVNEVPPGMVYAEDLAKELFGPDIVIAPRSGHVVRVEGKYLSRLYTLAKKGFMESVVLWPHYKRFYKVLDAERLRAEVAVKFLSKKYT